MPISADRASAVALACELVGIELVGLAGKTLVDFGRAGVGGQSFRALQPAQALRSRNKRTQEMHALAYSCIDVPKVPQRDAAHSITLIGV